MKKISFNKEELKILLEKHKREHICDLLGLSKRTLDRIIQKYQLQRPNFGPKHLTEETIECIKKFYKDKKYKQKDISKKFNISQSLVSKIVNDKSHKNLSNIKLTGQANIRIGFKYGN